MFQPLDRSKPSNQGQALGKSTDRSRPGDRDNLSPHEYTHPYGGEELLRYALEEKSSAHPVKEHLSQCKICFQQVENLIDASLVGKLYRSRCPDIDTLARYSANLASLSEGLSVFYHLQMCPLCSQELQEMKNILEEDLF